MIPSYSERAAIHDAKAAVNLAQVILADTRGLPLNVNVDEGDGSPVFVALAEAYAALCEAEEAIAK